MVTQSSDSARHMNWEEMQHLTLWVTDKLLDSLHQKIRLEHTPDTLGIVRERFDLLCQHVNINLPEPQSRQLYEGAASLPFTLEGVLSELVGFGPIDPLLQDDSVTEVMVNGPRQGLRETITSCSRNIATEAMSRNGPMLSRPRLSARIPASPGRSASPRPAAAT